MPYVTFSPGPTVNVLGSFDDKSIIQVSGHPSYRDKGALRMTTVIPTGPSQKVSIPTMVLAWLDPDRAVYPRSTLYGKADTRESVKEQGAAQMASSQDNAIASALGALHIAYTTKVGIAAVDPGGPANGKLEPGDVIVTVNGKDVTGVSEVTGAIRPLPVGSNVTMTVRRDGKLQRVAMTTTSAPDDAKASAVRVSIQAAGYKFPFEVKLKLDQNIGGPSAGMMFAMGIYDVLTPGLADRRQGDRRHRRDRRRGQRQPDRRHPAEAGRRPVRRRQAVPGRRPTTAPRPSVRHYDPEKMRLVKVTDARRRRQGRAGLGQGPERVPAEVHPMSAPRRSRPRRRRARGGAARRRARAGTSRRSCSHSSTPPT